MKEKLFFVADEGDGMLNVFARADFNEDGYHISDFDIVFESNRWEDVVRYTDKHSA